MLILLIAVAAIAGVSTMYVGWPKDEALPSARGEGSVMLFVAALLGVLAVLVMAAG